MLQFILGWCNLKWTRSTPLYHPLPTHITRSFLPTPLGPLELTISHPTTPDPNPKQPPILFIHGGFGHASVWLEYQTYLSTHYNGTTYALSLRNHGASYVCSSWFRMVYRTHLDDVASDVLAAIHSIEAREGTAPVLVCHSAGGALAQFILANGMAKTSALVLAGAVPHYGFMAPMWNWLSRVDWWMFLRGTLMFQHSRAALCTTLLVKNAFFGPEYPWEKVKEFEKWMAPYESMRWPAETIGSWEGGRNVWLDPLKIVGNITTTDASGDRILIMMGGEDKIMQGTQDRMVTEYAEAIRKLNLKRKESAAGEPKSSGVRLVEIQRAGHHLQNDVQWEESAKALVDFLQQLPATSRSVSPSSGFRTAR